MSDEENVGLKVQDKRRFNAAGDLRSDESESSGVSSSKTSGAIQENSSETSKMVGDRSISGSDAGFTQDDGVSSAEVRKVASEYEQSRGTNGDPSAQEYSKNSDIHFSSFIMSLATQALIQLGEIAPPEGMELPQDVASARQTIDMISMLNEKTKGNLTAEESSLITELLHNLRMSFIRVSNS